MQKRIPMQERVAQILGNHEDLAHPYSRSMKVSDAIEIVLNVLELRSDEDSCQNLQDVLATLDSIQPGHNWITGQYATQVVKLTLAKTAGADAAARKAPFDPSLCKTYVELMGNSIEDERLSPSLAKAWKEGFEIRKHEDAVLDHHI